MLTREQFFKKLGENIANLRKQQNLSIKELSLKSDISVRYLLKIENGEAVRITSKHICKLHNALKIPVYKFFKSL